jgi:hypothetical protein
VEVDRDRRDEDEAEADDDDTWMRVHDWYDATASREREARQ